MRRPLLQLNAPSTGPARRASLAAGAALCALIVWPACGQSAFPSRPLRLVVPAPPGGVADAVGRLLAEAMQTDLGQAVVVDNRTGAAGLIGTQAVAEAAADGYTVLLANTTSHIIAPLTQRSARVDAQRDLLPVGLAVRLGGGVIAIPAGVQAQTLAQFIGLAHSRPGQFNYASSGIGSTNHVLTERFKQLTGVDMVHVPYKGGSPMTTALMAGEVQFALLDFGTAEAALRAGKIRALAQAGNRRHPALPSVPTFAEAGLKDYDPSFWIGLAVPKATPRAVIDRLNTSLNQALAQTAIKARAQELDWTLVGGPPQVLADTVARDMAAYRDTVSALKLDRQ